MLLQHQDKLTQLLDGVGTVEDDAGNRHRVRSALPFQRPPAGRDRQAEASRPMTAALGTLDWDHHRRAVQNLTMRVERQWQRDLSWQTIDFTWPARARVARRARRAVSKCQPPPTCWKRPCCSSAARRHSISSAEQRKALKEYLENGGFLFAEACNGNGCNGEAFDRSFRALMRELFPDSELRKLPPDHAVWYAQEKVDPKHLPKDSEFWLWGLDACCRTSVVYCPRSLSCYWELAHPYRESDYPQGREGRDRAVARIGSNVLAYATSRELKEKLDRPQIVVSNPGGRSPRGALVVPKLSHARRGRRRPRSPQQPADRHGAAACRCGSIIEKRLVAPTDPKLLDYPIVFMHGRRAFTFSAAERKALKDYLDRGGFLFADAICANKEFADRLRAELKAIYPDAQFTRIPPTHSDVHRRIPRLQPA